MFHFIFFLINFFIQLIIFVSKTIFFLCIYIIMTIIEGIYTLFQKIKTRKKLFKIYNKDISHLKRLVIPSRTFFPSEWPQEKVLETITEAYKNFEQSGTQEEALPGGKYKCVGATSEGIKIEMYRTKSGVIINAFPILERSSQ